MYADSNVTVMVSDFGRAFDFYTETLGLSVGYRAGDEWATVSAPGLTIGLHPAGEQGPAPGQGGSLSIGFGVADIEQGVATLQQRGVEFPHGVRDDTYVKLAYFKDPDGHDLYLCENVPHDHHEA